MSGRTEHSWWKDDNTCILTHACARRDSHTIVGTVLVRILIGIMHCQVHNSNLQLLLSLHPQVRYTGSETFHPEAQRKPLPLAFFTGKWNSVVLPVHTDLSIWLHVCSTVYSLFVPSASDGKQSYCVFLTFLIKTMLTGFRNMGVLLN